jgi:hypothetical protein
MHFKLHSGVIQELPYTRRLDRLDTRVLHRKTVNICYFVDERRIQHVMRN